MIILNGKAFAESDKEFTESLFNPINGNTCVGYAKRLKRQVKLFDHQNNLIGVINKYGVLACANKVDIGYSYSYADIPQIGAYKSVKDRYDDIYNISTVQDRSASFEPTYQFK